MALPILPDLTLLVLEYAREYVVPRELLPEIDLRANEPFRWLISNRHPKMPDFWRAMKFPDPVTVNEDYLLYANPAWVPMLDARGLIDDAIKADRGDDINPNARFAGLISNSSERVVELLKLLPESDIAWSWLCENSHPWAVERIRANLHKFLPSWLSPNPGTVDIMLENPEDISVDHFLTNPSPQAFDQINEFIAEYGIPDLLKFLSMNANKQVFAIVHDHVMNDPKMYTHDERIWENPIVFEMAPQDDLRAILLGRR